LTSLENIGNSFTNLKVIDANANRIESLNIKEEEFPTLEALYLKNNKIKYFLHCPKSVQILCLDHNQLSKLAFSGGDNL
jgi:Leucine-rich repeat (LRR) protein